jgi:hypothetical protein
MDTRLCQRIVQTNHLFPSMKENCTERPPSEVRTERMEQEEQAKGCQGANGMASAVVLPAMSPFPSLASISFICSYLYAS